ncbi:MAG: STAS domain-containing protein [Acidimicrobiales bacterium]
MVDLGVVVDERAGWAVVAVSGEIDMATAPALRERLHVLLSGGASNIIIDLDGVGFLDSTALGVLVGTMKRARAVGGDVRLVCTQPRVAKVLEITRLDQAFSTFTSVEGALEASGL